MKRRGLFITFEGTEGSGKSTQMQLLGERFKKNKIPVLLTREPGGSKLTTHLRRWILDELGYALTFEAELFLFLADRAQHVQEVIKPALRAGKVVLCDRYTDSTLAYQGGGRGFDLKMLEAMNQIASGGIRPDLTLLFDLPVELGLRRALGRGRGRDRMEKEKIRFHQKVRRVFLSLARTGKKRFIVLNARPPKNEVFEAMVKALQARLSPKILRRVG